MTTTAATLRLGTRGSLLARTQSRLIADAVEKLRPGVQVELVVLKTTADQIPDRPLYDLGGKGLFTKEIEQALLADAIDFAVHSYKDLPVTMPLVEQSGLVIAATPQREDPADVLVVRASAAGVAAAAADPFSSLPRGARIGTTSLRRRAQLLHARPDLVIEPLRGNVDSRLSKLRQAQYDAIVLAYAGLHRVGLFDASFMHVLSDAAMLGAPAQGALAVQCRRDDARVVALLAPLNHESTADCVAAERAVVAALGGDCHSPIAARATIADGLLSLSAAVGARGGTPPILRAVASAPQRDARRAVSAVVASLESGGVRPLLAGTGPA